MQPALRIFIHEGENYIKRQVGNYAGEKWLLTSDWEEEEEEGVCVCVCVQKVHQRMCIWTRLAFTDVWQFSNTNI